MKKLSVLLLLIIVTLFGCNKNSETPDTETNGDNQQTPTEVVNTRVTEIINGGFETADLSGWTVLSGNAFTDDSVSSRKSFTYSYDKYRNEIQEKGYAILDSKDGYKIEKK